MISFLAVLIFDLGDFKESVRFLLLACWRAFMAFLPWAGRELMADIDVFTIFKPCLSSPLSYCEISRKHIDVVVAVVVIDGRY